jgi:omega-amidase
MSKIKLAVCQLLVSADKAANIVAARKAIRTAAEAGASFVVLPEIFNGPYATALFHTFAEEEGGETYTMLSDAAREHGICVVGGTIAERQGGKLFNTCYSFGTDGGLLAKYRKAHLVRVLLGFSVVFFVFVFCFCFFVVFFFVELHFHSFTGLLTATRCCFFIIILPLVSLISTSPDG